MQNKLYMIMVGCTPAGRFTEQHDVFFGIGSSLKELVPQISDFWPEAKGKLHIDAWREVTSLNGYSITVTERIKAENQKTDEAKLFFLNLGGYKENEFDEFHYKMLLVAENSSEAIKAAKQTAFYKHMGFKSATSKGATSHIDEKYGVDVDDFHSVGDILSPILKEKFEIKITRQPEELPEDEIHLGYFILSKITE